MGTEILEFISSLPQNKTCITLKLSNMEEGWKFYEFSLHKALGNTKLLAMLNKFKYPKMSRRGVYAVLVGRVLNNVVFTLDQPSYLIINNNVPISSVIIIMLYAILKKSISKYLPVVL